MKAGNSRNQEPGEMPAWELAGVRGGETEDNLGEERAEELQERPFPRPQAHLPLPSPAEYVGKFEGGRCSL